MWDCKIWPQETRNIHLLYGTMWSGWASSTSVTGGRMNMYSESKCRVSLRCMAKKTDIFLQTFSNIKTRKYFNIGISYANQKELHESHDRIKVEIVEKQQGNAPGFHSSKTILYCFVRRPEPRVRSWRRWLAGKQNIAHIVTDERPHFSCTADSGSR